jgi:hypothetical protein
MSGMPRAKVQHGLRSGRFLKKAAQKLLFMLGHGRCRRYSPQKVALAVLIF